MTANPFTQHPHEIGESYWQHQRRALGFAVCLLLAGGAALVHALLPFLFVHTGSRMIGRLHASMVARRHPPTDAQPSGAIAR